MTEYWNDGITIVSLSCLVCLPQPTPDGRFLPQTTKPVQVDVGILDFIFPNFFLVIYYKLRRKK
jgi:hypothetical protein